jgi:hypothetical protein
MTQRRLVTSVATFLFLTLGMLPVCGEPGKSEAMAPAAPAGSTASQSQAPSPTGPEIKKVEDLLGGDLFTPAPLPRCAEGACWGDGSPCGPYGDGVCYQPGGTGCGICRFS